MNGAVMEQGLRVLNFVVVGSIRSGSTIVQTAINNRTEAVCHGELFHPDATVRREAHEGYFGESKDPERFPEWFVPDITNPIQYINHAVLDNPQNSECAVGFRIMYADVRKWELCELFETRFREGDFCLIHAVRNPVACFASLKQAERSKIWTRNWSDPLQTGCPSPLALDQAELTEFCRNHAAIQSKIRASCADHLEVHYKDLFTDFQGVMRKVFEFLELPDSDDLAQTSCRRLKNKPVLARINNLADLRRALPSDVRNFLDAEDLF